MLITAEDGTRNYLSLPVIGTVLILLGGHGINLALSGLGSFVHPLRLTFVEFYKNLDFKGGAQAYSPFSKH
jgi:V/A-type H+-transporting ATPase subunit I